MKKIIWVAGGLCAAAAGLLAWGVRRPGPLEDLAHRHDEPKLEEPNPEDLQADDVAG